MERSGIRESLVGCAMRTRLKNTYIFIELNKNLNANNIDVLRNYHSYVFCTGRTSTSAIHVYYAEYTATVDINTCEMINGTAWKANKTCFGMG